MTIVSPPPTGPMAELHWQVNTLVQGGQYRYKEELQQWVQDRIRL